MNCYIRQYSLHYAMLATQVMFSHTHKALATHFDGGNHLVTTELTATQLGAYQRRAIDANGLATHPVEKGWGLLAVRCLLYLVNPSH